MRKPLAGHRHDAESDNAVMCCNDWLRLGRGRSMRRLFEQYSETLQSTPKITVPTTS